MTPKAEIILEGTYLYYTGEVNYSQEEFKLVHFTNEEVFHFYAEIVSRLENGEFLKILVRYEMNSQFIPTFVRIEKSLGNKYALETFKIDISTFELKYAFQTNQKVHEFKKNVTSKHYLTSPAVCTSGIFTLSKKMDANARTAINFISSANEWGYSAPPTEKSVFAEFKSRDYNEFHLHGNALSASHLCLYEKDSINSPHEVPVELYLSKHYAVPYQLNYGDQKIVIKNLKKNT
jgi:hypothetical protein